MKGFIRNYSLSSAACLRSGCLRSSPSSGKVRGHLPGEDLLLTELHSVIILLDNECSGLIGTGFRKSTVICMWPWGERRKPKESGVENLILWERYRMDPGGLAQRDAEQVCSCSGPLCYLALPWDVGGPSKRVWRTKPLLMGWNWLDLLLFSSVENVACLWHSLRSFNNI